MKRLLPRINFHFAAFVIAGVMMATTYQAPALAGPKSDAAVNFMNRVSKEMLHAVKKDSARTMRSVITRYADVPVIGAFSLGSYLRKLPKGHRRTYHQGMTRFMARYLISQSRTYKIASARIISPSFREENAVMVDSQVVLKDGTAYDVRWRLVKRGKTFKIRDAQVMGFWLMPFQRNLFRTYIQERNGNVSALVTALNY